MSDMLAEAAYRHQQDNDERDEPIIRTVDNYPVHFQDGETRIYEEDGDLLGTIDREMSDDEVHMWCEGFNAGMKRGHEYGRRALQYDLRNLLGAQP